MLRNLNYILRFRFWLLSVLVPAPFLNHEKAQFSNIFGKNLAFLHSKLFYKKKIDKCYQIYCKMWMNKVLSEGNQIRYFISSLWELLRFHFITDPFPVLVPLRQKVTIPAVPFRNTAFLAHAGRLPPPNLVRCTEPLLSGVFWSRVGGKPTNQVPLLLRNSKFYTQ